MGTIYLVRHGQASFGAANYDQLSDLGTQQSVRLGEYFAARGVNFEAVFTGTLKRHVQTWRGIAQGAHMDLHAHTWSGLDEYNGQAIIAALHKQKPDATDTPDTPDTHDLYKHHFRLLRAGLTQWMRAAIQPEGMSSYTEFVRGITSALDHVRWQYGGNVLIISSGGPISAAVGHILGATPEATVELNMHIRNSSVTELTFSPRRHTLLTYNTLPHLDAPQYASWITYA